MLSRSTQPAQVLVAIEEAAERDRALKALGTHRFRTLSAALADETWVHLQTETGAMPAVVILSATYPVGMSGLELIARMRAEIHTRHVPALLLLPDTLAPDHPCAGCRVARWDWCLARPNDIRTIVPLISEIVHTGLADEPFHGPVSDADTECWRWWRARLAELGLVYPGR
jgi:CheY-like chemotaxis protein